MCGTQPPIVRKHRRDLLGLLRVESGMEPPERVDGFVGHAVGDGARVDQLVHRRPESLLGIAAAR